MSDKDILEKLKARHDSLLQWMREEHPECSDEQKHLDAGTVEQTYWHYGYMVALGDVINILLHRPPRIRGEPKPPVH